MTEQTASLLMMLVFVALIFFDWRQTITIVNSGRSELNGVLKYLWRKTEDKDRKKVTDAYFIACMIFWVVLYVLFWPEASFSLAIVVALCYPWEVWCVMNNVRLKIKPAGF